MLIENTFKKYLVEIMGTRWDVQSHEDKYSEGIPDLSFGANGINGWIELKQIKEWPKMEKTSAKPKKYTAQQVNWLVRRGKKGGSCFIAVKIASTKEYFLFNWTSAREVKKGMTKSDFHAQAVGYWKTSIQPEELINLLTKVHYHGQ